MKQSTTMAAGLAFAALMAGPALAQADFCLNQDDARAVASAFMPEILEELAQHCEPALGNGSFLASEDLGRMITRAKPLSRRSRDDAMAGLARMMGVPIRAEEGEALMVVARLGLRQAMIEGMDESDCRLADQMIELIEPLPPENVIELSVLLMQLGSEESSDDPFRLCPLP